MYVDDFLNWIDARKIRRLVINLFEEAAYDTQQFAQFISCTPMDS